MEIAFTKYHGTGNDFIMINDLNGIFPFENHELIAKLCHRRFGIGADGLILIGEHETHDFSMKYFNADGHEGSMCGNGGRCTVHFARELGLISGFTYFMATDGLHKADIEEDYVSLGMGNVSNIEKIKDFYYLDTGSPHVVIEVDDIENTDVIAEGRRIRYNQTLFPNGTNVNFIQLLDQDHIKIRTYERGVEDETWSCGTGSVAAAIVTSIIGQATPEKEAYQIYLEAPGGNLKVSFEKTENSYQNIFLKGPATKVFEGKIQLKQI